MALLNLNFSDPNLQLDSSNAEFESESEFEFESLKTVSNIIDDIAEYNKTLITLKAEWKQAVHNKKMILYKLDSEIAEAKLKLNSHINSKRI